MDASKGSAGLFYGFENFTIDIPNGDVKIFGRNKGNGPPLLLLHGFPQNHRIWHLIAGRLAETYTVVTIDLRGYGGSSKPAGDAKHVTYSKRVMAQDCVDVMEKLGHQRFYICAHDRGARVAHKLCVDHQYKVKKAMLLDIAPTVAMYSKTNFDFAKAYFHWFFLIQPSPFPEDLISSNPKALTDFSLPETLINPECLESYHENIKDPTCVHAMCEDYRASASIDMEEHKEDDKNGRKIQCPLMVLWAKKGVIEKLFDAVAEWKDVSDSTVVGESLDCGHYIPEEKPEELLRHMLDFFKD